ncbi:MAG: CHAT domain-containing protein [Nitriliruptorales bacterium]|nr:CHAT domain-containing protein [Nitriliruptorales bacterium]
MSSPISSARTSSAAVAAEALQLAQAQPSEARALATRVLGESTANAGARSVAQEALGLAAKEMHDLDGSLVALRQSVDIAARAGLRERTAHARMSLAFVLLSRGEPQQALREANLAARVLRGRDAARLHMRRGVIFQRLGRLDDALAAYHMALPVLRRAGDRLWEARLLSNRGVLHVYRSEFPAAERDLQRAAELHDQLGQKLAAAQTRHNLGFAAARRGDVPTALAWYDDADLAYGELGLIDWVGVADRCELLLTARLLDEAREFASHAVAALTRSGTQSDLSEARLTLANAALLDGDYQTAREVAERAHAEFVRQGRRRWATTARYAILRARWLEGERSHELQIAAGRTAGALARSGWDVAAADSRLIAARIALARGDLRAALRMSAATSAVRQHGPVELRARAWHAEALLRLARGNSRGADAALRAGMRALDRHRATLGSTELRVHVAGHAGDIATLALRLAVEAGDANRTLRWAERWRAGTLFLRPVRPPDDARLNDDLVELRATMARLDDAALAGEDTRPLLRRQAALERSLQRRSRRTQAEKTDSSESLRVAALTDALGDRALVEMVAIDDELYAAVVAGGRVRLRRLGSQRAAVAEIDALQFALRRLAGQQRSGRRPNVARDAARYAAQRLDELLMHPVMNDIVDRPLVVVPTGPLHALPWSFLPSCTHRSVTVAPSALLWQRAATRDPGKRRSGDVVFVGGDDPPHAAAEVTTLHQQYPDSRLLVGSAATTQAVTTALDGAAIAHLACHGRFRADNPLFSCLQLADGPLTVYDLERLGTAPRVLLLSACESGLSAVRSGDELMGLSSALFSLGTTTLIASVTPVPDAGTRAFMVEVHDQLRRGASPATALARARMASASEDADDVAAAAFVCLGAG